MLTIKSRGIRIINSLFLLSILSLSLITSLLLSANTFAPSFAQSSFANNNSTSHNNGESLSNPRLSLRMQNQQNQQSLPQPFLSSIFTDIYKQAKNSVVMVNGPNILGTGFVYDNLGHIVTTNYVINETINSTAQVTFSDGYTFSAKVIGNDAEYDLAVLQLDKQALSQEPLRPLPFANSTTVQIGEPVISIGNPYGLSFSISNEVVSGLDRMMPSFDTSSSSFSAPNAIQTTGIINPGDAGSPLINSDGKAIGMIIAVYTGSNGSFSGINFAVSSNTLHKVIPSLVANATYKHPWVGINGFSLTFNIAKALDLRNQTTGFVVTYVAPGSPADKAGIQAGNVNKSVIINNKTGATVNLDTDIIIGIDNKQVKSIQDILGYVESSKNIGDIVVFKVMRGDGNNNNIVKDILVKLEERPLLSRSSNSLAGNENNTIIINNNKI